MRCKITKRTVDALWPVDGKETTLWDSEVKGFGVRARAGGARTYILRYRPGGGRKAPLRTFTIGRHGSPWTPDEARGEAKRLLGVVQDGADPAASRMQYRDAPTLAELAHRFLAEHVDTKCKPYTADQYRRWVERIILPGLGAGTRVLDVSFGDVTKLHHSLRHVPYQANRVVAVLSKMMTLAASWGMRPSASNPCQGVQKFGERKRERMLSGDELARLADALAVYRGSSYVVAAVKLLVFTGARLSEVLGLRWSWIDFERGEARLPDSKTGAKTLHLPPPALSVLAELHRLKGNPHVIIGDVEGARLVNLEKPWRRIRERATVLLWAKSEDLAAASVVSDLRTELKREPTPNECLSRAAAQEVELVGGLLDVRLHDLRHAFASIAASRGMGLPIIGKMLGHTQAATTQRYAHLASDPVKAAAHAVASEIEAFMNGNAGTVIGFGKR